MITKNILYKYFKDFADNHLQIKDYGYGDLWEISSSQATQYPLFWVSPQPSSIAGNEITYNFNILIGDRLEDGDANKVEVESDTFQIGLDLLATLNLDRELDLDKNNTLTPFIHDFKDRIAGHLITLSVSAPFDYNECAVPTTGTPQPPASSCPVAIITINGVSYGSVGSGNTEDISVVDGSGTPVGSLVSGNWVVSSSCPDATAVLKNSAGTTISTTLIGSGASANITAPDASAVLKNTDSTTLSTTDILSGSSANITAPDSTITINSATFSPYPSGATSNILVKDGTGTQVGSKVGSEWIVPTGVEQSGVLLQFPTSSQYTSYRTGDEGWRVQNGWFNYTRPTYPKSIAELDYTNANYWYLLKNNLIVGGVSNKTRFVDVDGGQTWSATSNKDLIVIDKLTGLGIYRPQDNSLLKASWDIAIDDGLSLSIIVNSITYSDWYLMSLPEFTASIGVNIKANNWVDPISTNVILPTVFTGSQLTYLTSTTALYNTILCYSPRFTTISLVDITTFPKASSNGRPFYIFDARNLITAP